MKLTELRPRFLRVISLLSLEEEKGMARICPLSYCRLKGIRSCFLSREVGRGSLLLSGAVAKDLTRDLFHKKRPSFFLGQGKKRSRRKGGAPSLLAKQKSGPPLSLQKEGKSFTSSLNNTLKLFVVNQKRFFLAECA